MPKIHGQSRLASPQPVIPSSGISKVNGQQLEQVPILQAQGSASPPTKDFATRILEKLLSGKDIFSKSLLVSFAFGASIIDSLLGISGTPSGIMERLHSKLIFIPDRTQSPLPDNVPYERVEIETSDKKTLRGLFFPHPQVTTSKTVIYLHGNEGNVYSWWPDCVEMQKHVPVNILLVDYRGYGDSDDEMPTRASLSKDITANHDFLINRGVKPKDIYPYGISLGAVAAIILAASREVGAVAAGCPFASIREIAKDRYPPLAAFAKNDLLNAKRIIKKVHVPFLIFHGIKDKDTPIRHTYMIYNAANNPKRILTFEEAEHTLRSYFNEEYYSALRELFV